MSDILSHIEAVEEALAHLSNALFELDDLKNPNVQWADAAVDRAAVDMAKLRSWCIGE